jgi:hypothetical protein
MIIWGGVDTSNATLNSGAKYYPGLSPTWSAMSTIGTPAPRAYHNAVWTGAEMIVFSGATGLFTLNDAAKYEPSGDLWSPVSSTNAPLPRYMANGVWAGDRLLIWGGWDGATYFNDGGQLK